MPELAQQTVNLPDFMGGTIGTRRQIELPELDSQFVSRMEEDINSRRKNAFINELKNDPRFKPSMVNKPPPKYMEVAIEGLGPVIATHKAIKTPK
jgi:hypothetical protein